MAVMSAAGRSDVRRPDDFYETPAWCVHRLLEALPFRGPRRWLEPCVGDGAILRAVHFYGLSPMWTAYEIRADAVPTSGGCVIKSLQTDDFLAAARAGRDDPEHDLFGRPFDVVLTNPPYSLAMEFVEACLPLAREVAMLLRLNFLASERRAAFMRSDPPDVYVLPNRPSFTGGGTDATEYCWAVWPRVRHRRAGLIRVLASTQDDERGRRRRR